MIRARGKVMGLNTLMLGLSDENLEKLRETKPILVNRLQFHGDSLFEVPLEQVMIFWGRSNEEMYQVFKRAGMLVGTKLHGLPGDES